MSAVASAIKSEIQRVARKEIKGSLTLMRKATVQHRRDIAALKREVVQLKRQNAVLLKAAKQADTRAATRSEDGGERQVRFSASGLRKLRARLGIGAGDLGRLLNVSAQSVYNWEQEKSSPRREQVVAIAKIRSWGKRQARMALEAH